MKVAVIGLGFMGAAHVGAIRSYADAELVAVASRDPKTRTGDFTHISGNLDLGQCQFDFSHVRQYTTWNEVLADHEVDAVSICLPTHLHAEVTVAAFSEGKHVICEKPMALTSYDCDRMLEAAANANRTLMIGQVLRFWPEYIALRDFVTKGEHGLVLQATFIRKSGVPEWSRWLTDEAESGGAVMDLLVHDIDQILLLFGVPERVTAKRLGDTDALMASFIYPGGPEVRLQGGWFAPGVPFRMSFQVRAHSAELELSLDGLSITDMKGSRQTVDVPAGNAYAAEMHYFLDCCRNHVAPVLCPPAESANAVRVALALKSSRANNGEQIKCLV